MIHLICEPHFMGFVKQGSDALALKMTIKIPAYEDCVNTPWKDGGVCSINKTQDTLIRDVKAC